MNQESEKVSEEEIAQCIAILESLSLDTNQVFELPEQQRIALMKAAGKLSRPNRGGSASFSVLQSTTSPPDPHIKSLVITLYSFTAGI